MSISQSDTWQHVFLDQRDERFRVSAFNDEQTAFCRPAFEHPEHPTPVLGKALKLK